MSDIIGVEDYRSGRWARLRPEPRPAGSPGATGEPDCEATAPVTNLNVEA
jgi:hypothetical protein